MGLPLLFTQEVWWHATLLPAAHILALLVIAFGIVVGFTRIEGFRREASWTEVLVDAVEAMGLGIVVAFVALLLLGRIEVGTSLRDVIGQVALESIPVAFGASIARAELGGGDEDEEQRAYGPFERLFVAAGGALLFTLNIAPTEEPVQLGIEASPLLLLAAVAASLAITLLLVFYADFGSRRPEGRGLLDRPIPETVAAYALSLGVSYVLLWAWGRVDGVGLEAIVGMTVVLGIVGSLGAAVGRILVTGSAGEEGGQRA